MERDDMLRAAVACWAQGEGYRASESAHDIAEAVISEVVDALGVVIDADADGTFSIVDALGSRGDKAYGSIGIVRRSVGVRAQEPRAGQDDTIEEMYDLAMRSAGPGDRRSANGLLLRIKSAARSLGARTMRDLSEVSEEQFRGMKGVGGTTMNAAKMELASRGLSFRPGGPTQDERIAVDEYRRAVRAARAEGERCRPGPMERSTFDYQTAYSAAAKVRDEALRAARSVVARP
jgi:hypothetical protein